MADIESELSVLKDVASEGTTNDKQTLEKVKKAVRPLILRRATQKRSITLTLDKLTEDHSVSFIKSQVSDIKSKLKVIEGLDLEILEMYDGHGILETYEDVYNQEMEGQTEYHFQINLRISKLNIEDCEPELNKSTQSVEQLEAMLKVRQASVHEVKLPIFKGSQDDVLLFSDFIRQFKDLIGDRVEYSDSLKLIYLKSYLKGGALDIIKHLSNDNANYQLALDFLTKEYLDKDLVVDRQLRQLMNLKPLNNYDIDGLRAFFNTVRGSVYELKNFGLDALQDESLGSKLLSFLLCEKLPSNFKWKLSVLIKTDYPSVSQLLDSYNEIIKSLEKTSMNRGQSYSKPGSKSETENLRQNKPSPNLLSQSKFSQNKYAYKGPIAPSSLQNFKTQNSESKPQRMGQFASRENKGNKIDNVQLKVCKLCKGSHSMIKCPTYSEPFERVERLRQLKLCEFCSGDHLKENCVGRQNGLTFPCTICNSRAHIGAVCPSSSTGTASSMNNLCIFNNNSSSNTEVILPSVSVIVGCGEKSQTRCKLVRCMVDPGSQSSYISERLKIHLGLKDLPEVKFNLRTFMGSCEKTYEVAKCYIYVTPKHRVVSEFLVDKQFDIDYKVPGIGMIVDNLVSANFSLADTFYHDCEMSASSIDGFDVLLGSDLIKYLEPMSTVGVGNGTALSIDDGLIIFGPASDFLTSEQQSFLSQKCNTSVRATSLPVSTSTTEMSNCSTIESSDNIDKQVNFILNPHNSYFNPILYAKSDPDMDVEIENLFRVESLGIKDRDLSEVDLQMVENFDNQIECRNERYYVKLPFKECINEVPSNWKISLATLDRVIHSLQTKGLMTEYDDIFQKQLDMGIIEEISISPENYENFVFIPHHPVIRTEAQVSTKVRCVLNASLKSSKNAPSLNEATFQGIDLLNSLLTLIIRFRQNKYVLLSDIEKAFLQIFLKDDNDKNKFCFFWRSGNELKIYRYNTIIFGLNCSPFILNHVVRHHLNKFEDGVTVGALKNSLYVDNFIFSSSDPDELEKIYNESREIMSKGGFNLRSWATNYPNLESKMTNDNVHVTHGEPIEKLLGYNYDKRKDVLQLSDFELRDSDSLTKREVLGQTSKVFDPLSLMVPVTIRGRILMKSIWKEKIDWDDLVPDHLMKIWLKIRSDYLKLKELEIPRMTMNLDKPSSYSVNIFCDGSKDSYGFCAYVSEEGNGSNLIFSKAKITPEAKSIPQIELLAIFMAYKCLPVILESLNCPIKEINVWSDSQIALEWVITGPKVTNKFTKNRIQDIKLMRDKIESQSETKLFYRYISTGDNVADFLTRGLSFKEFKNKLTLWLKGPQWINDKLQWPVHDLNCLSTNSKSIINASLINDEKKLDVQPIVDINKFSSLDRLLGVTSKVFAFINKIKRKEADSFYQANLYWLKFMQSQCFAQELDFLNSEVKSESVPCLVKDLNLFLDGEGVIRCKGRLSKLNFYSYNVINPVLLSKHHLLTKLIVRAQHERCKHLGVGSTLMQLRENGFWLPSGRQAVKEIIKSCIFCEKMNAFSMAYPKLTNLPKERLELIKPYLHTAIDYTGHLFVFDENKKETKVYIVLYTCLALRCVHLDVVPDLSLNSFLLSFKRFTSIYCTPDSIYTDNGTQFVASKNYLSQAFLSNEFKNHLEHHSIKHKTIPAGASWAGGIYERQIKTMKQCLYKTLGRAKVSYFELITCLADIQNCINNRPITYVHSEIDEIEALTPNKILKLNINPRLQLIESGDELDPLWAPEGSSKSLHKSLIKTLNVQNQLFEDYKKLWYGQYLLSLREHTRDVFQTDWTDRLSVGNIVLVSAQNKPRIFWQMGRILKLIHSDDGKVRSVMIKMPNKEEAHYSVKHLYPLEVQTMHTGERCDTTQDKSDYSETNKPNPINHQETRPKRQAAQTAEKLIKHQFQMGQI